MNLAKQYKFSQNYISGFNTIEITEGEFHGVEYYYTGVYFDEHDNECTLKFGYNLLSSATIPDEKIDDFRNLLGYILVDILNNQLENGEVVYYGGRDEV